VQLLSNDDEIVQQTFIENLARTSALEVLTNDRISYETMNTMCKLSPSDFILTAKRTQDLINSIHELVIQGETLSSDVAGA
jgi:molybdenum cofactor biosynthesis enzyme